LPLGNGELVFGASRSLVRHDNTRHLAPTASDCFMASLLTAGPVV
jgi:hypothetical protein